MTKANTKPLVSIILPVFKSERVLEKCLQSLSNQSYKNIEIVAVVDYLGDDSLRILRRYKKIDKRLRVYSNLQRYGLSSTLNRCIRLSKGQYIAFMNPYAIALPTRISKQVKFLKANEKVAGVGTQIITINHKGRKTGFSLFPTTNEIIYPHLIGSESIKAETVTLDRTRLPKDILKFKKDTHYPYVYIDVFMKIGQYKQLANLDEPLVKIQEVVSENKKTLNIDKKITFIKLLFTSTTLYEYKPAFRSLLTPIIKQV